MGYQRRGSSFSFMGAVPIGKTFEVVPEEQETPVLAAWPPKGYDSVGGTVTMPLATFSRGRSGRNPRCRISVG